MIEWLLVARLLAPAGCEELRVEAEARYEAGDYDAAVRLLEKTYACNPDPDFLYARGVSERLRGDCDASVQVFEEFLATGPEPKQAQAAVEEIRKCREPEPDPQPAPQPDIQPAPVEDAPPPEPKPTPWHRDRLGGALLGTGLGLTAAGVALFVVGARRHRGVAGEPSHADFESALRTNATLRGVGLGLAGVGTSLVIGAVIRYAILRRR